MKNDQIILIELWEYARQKQVGNHCTWFPRSQIWCTVIYTLKKLLKSPYVSNTTQSPLYFRHSLSFNTGFSQALTTCDPPSCPRRGSPHHKIVMHVNFTVHGSNKPWQWMLSDFKRLQPYAPPSVCLPSTCLSEECAQKTGWVRGSKFTDREEGRVTCMRFNMDRWLSLMHSALINTRRLHTLTALFFQFCLKSRHI